MEAPEISIPDEFAHLWVKFFDVSDQVSRISDGICGRIPPSEYLAWMTLKRISLSTFEFDLLVHMDEAFSTAMTLELADRRKAAEEEAIQKGKAKGR